MNAQFTQEKVIKIAEVFCMIPSSSIDLSKIIPYKIEKLIRNLLVFNIASSMT